MPQPTQRVALFPGTFDPLHLGHLDLIRRGARLFDQVVIGIGDNPEKQALLDIATRADIARAVTDELSNVRVETYTGLTVDLAAKLGADVILRGVRNMADLDFELRMAVTNRAATGVETLFIMPSPAVAFISSSLVKQIARGGGNVSTMVPRQALMHLTGE